MADNLSNTDHDVIWEILENFDFDRVHSVMTYLGWTWHKQFKEEPEQVFVPDVNQLRTEARRRMIAGIEWARDNGSIQYLSSSGGFEVTVDIDAENKAWVSLKFILTEWGNYE
jgi:hypothetical protein